MIDNTMLRSYCGDINKNGVNAMWGALRNSGFRWLWIGQILSQLGNAMFLVMGLWEIQLKSPFLLSIAGLGMSLPSLLGVAGGVLADRYSPARLMLGTDALRGLAVMAGLLMIWWQPGWAIGIIIAIISINSLGGALFGPSELVVWPLFPASNAQIS